MEKMEYFLRGKLPLLCQVKPPQPLAQKLNVLVCIANNLAVIASINSGHTH